MDRLSLLVALLRTPGEVVASFWATWHHARSTGRDRIPIPMQYLRANGRTSGAPRPGQAKSDVWHETRYRRHQAKVSGVCSFVFVVGYLRDIDLSVGVNEPWIFTHLKIRCFI